MNKTLLKNSLLQQFAKEYDKSVDGFSTEDKLYLTEVFIEFSDRIRSKEDYSTVYQTVVEEKILKKYRDNPKKFTNLNFLDYMLQDSLKYFDLLHDKGIETTSGEDQFLSDKDYRAYMDGVKKFLGAQKQALYLEPVTKAEDHASDPEEVRQINKEYTTRRQVLAMYYLNKYIDINNSNKEVPLINFIGFLTGKNTSNITKFLRNPHKISATKRSRADEELIKDLEFIRSYFEGLCMNTIVTHINRDIKEVSRK